MKVTFEAALGIIGKYRARLRLEHWRLLVIIHKTGSNWPKKHKDAVAFVKVVSGYQQATIHLHKADIEASDETLEQVLVHELVHLIWDKIWITVGDTELERAVFEEAVEQTTAAILNASQLSPDAGVKFEEEA